ncbi:MAG TPA: GNAT family N-acetyltransferase [Candidatus Limnocylindria bacterium]|nr:GNAT family N-acetyltransferase [Candidatus Limnocylindria bacterium]
MTTTTSRLRAFTSEDYPAWVAGANLSYPDYPWSVEEARHDDEKWDHSRFFKTRIVAEEDGQLVGAVEVYHRPSRFHPDRYGFDVWVRPDRRRRGHGGALHDAATTLLRQRNAMAATAGVKESMTDGVEFTRKRGWVEVKRDWESRLPVAAFDFDRFAGAAERVAAQGVRMSTYADELARDPEAPRKAYELVDECRRDVPAMDAPTDVSFEDWKKDWTEAPGFLPDAFFVAIDGAGRWLAMSNLQRSIEDPSFIWQGLTGVRREARGRGLAMALKLLTVRHAQRLGVDHIKTWNDQRNRPMLAINEAMGFEKQPAWIGLELRLRP